MTQQEPNHGERAWDKTAAPGLSATWQVVFRCDCGGVAYAHISACNRSDAVQAARRLAESEGHTGLAVHFAGPVPTRRSVSKEKPRKANNEYRRI